MSDYPKVLVTCTVYDGKAYCFDRWIEMAKGLTYPNREIFVVDNSKAPDFYEKYRVQIPMARLTFEGQKDDKWYRVCRSMAEVQRYFLARDYEYWMNIESDNVPPSDIIEMLLAVGKPVDADWTQHCYPTYTDPNGTMMQGIGCALFSRRLMTDFDWSDETIADDSPDAELWTWVQKQGIYPTVEIWYARTVQHLK